MSAERVPLGAYCQSITVKLIRLDGTILLPLSEGVMNMKESLDDLAAFLAVATKKSFTRAAAQPGISQPALSAKMTALEERLGV